MVHQPEQDLCHAFVVCSDTFFNYKSYKGVGVLWESLPGTNPFAPPSPMPGGAPGGNVEDSFRENSHWIKMVIAESGYLAFDLVPLNIGDFFQILVFKGNGSCESPSSFTFVRSASNRNDLFSAPTYTLTGIKLSSSETTKNKATPLYVNAGEVYYIRILSASKYIDVNPLLRTAVPAKGGYILDLSMKTCKFEIGPPPLIASIDGDGCDNGQYIDILLNRNINCNSIEINGSDFTLSPGAITGALGTGCSLGEGLTSKIRLFYDGEIAPGHYTLNVQQGTDGNTLLDICYQESPLPQSISFEVQKLKDTVTLYVCKGAMPYTWNGMTFSSTGSMIASYKTKNHRGCDSVTYLNLFTVDSFVHEETVYACEGIFPFEWYGGLITESYGSHVLRYVFTAEGGCDSIVYLNVVPQTVSNIDSHIVACNSTRINDVEYTESTNFFDTIYNKWGCVEKVIAYDLDIFIPGMVENITVDTGSCGYLYLGDRLIYKDSVIVDTLKTWFGCDSIIIKYNVDITPNVEPEMNRYLVSVCDSFVINDILVKNDTVLTFLFKNQYNCDSVVNIYYVSIDTLDLDVIALPQRPVQGELIRLYASSSQPNVKVTYWKPEQLFENQNASFQSILVNDPMTIIVQAEDSRGCIAVDTLIIDNIDTLIKHEAAPNAFSPNGDGLNDVFRIVLPNERGREIVSVLIYDRWGKLVFSDYGNNDFQWKGNYGNTDQPAPVGVYYFQLVVRYIDGEEKTITGDVTLMR